MRVEMEATLIGFPARIIGIEAIKVLLLFELPKVVDAVCVYDANAGHEAVVNPGAGRLVIIVGIFVKRCDETSELSHRSHAFPGEIFPPDVDEYMSCLGWKKRNIQD